tara:strand:+ start:119 stop:427 length:309 start_codon:yes stop_codon:yes gene_type:complete
MSSCKTCDTQGSIIETQSEITQRKMQNQVRVHSSLYTMQLGALNNRVNNENVGVKHGSYERRLQKLKYKTMIQSKQESTETPKYGNKDKSYNITSYVNTCSC